MAIQVWRPENERPGRHFVYTTRYVYFFVHLLDQLDDRAGLDQLLRRVRKRQGDFINHPKLWEDICLTYGRIIRRAGKINEGHEEGIFKPIGWDEFVANTGRLENLPELVAPESASLLELLRDSIELKKLNNNLMKVSLLEDLIADLYSRLYELNLPHVIEQASEENKEKMKVDHLMNLDGVADAPPVPGAGGPTPNPPGTTATATATTTSAPGPAQPTTSTEAPTSVPRGRTKGIARRDVQKRAEAIVASKLTTRPPTKPTTTGATTTTEIEPQNATGTATTSTVSTKAPKTEPGTKDKEPRESGDESELSEIDEDKTTKPDAERQRSRVFPNRKTSSPQEPGSEMSIPDGYGDGEGDGGETANEGEGEGEGDTVIEESFISAAPGDETEVVDEEEEGDEGDEEGGDVADGEDGDDEGEGDNDNEGEGETDILKDTEEGAEGEGEGEQEQEQATGDDPDAMET